MTYSDYLYIIKTFIYINIPAVGDDQFLHGQKDGDEKWRNQRSN